jgi:hypothetical protein
MLANWWYYIPWARRINAGGWRVDGKKVGLKLSALELIGPLVVVAAAADICRGRPLQVWVDNAGSVEVYRKGYSRSCRLCTTVVKAMATVAAGIGCQLEVLNNGRPVVEGEVPGLQADSGRKGLAPQGGASQDTGGPAQVAGQAVSL